MTAQSTDAARRVTWHCSDEGTGPDVGISIGLGGGRCLWAGEITREEHEAGGPAVAALGTERAGWWLILYDKRASQVLARFADAEAARAMIDAIEAMATEMQG